MAKFRRGRKSFKRKTFRRKSFKKRRFKRSKYDAAVFVKMGIEFEPAAVGGNGEWSLRIGWGDQVTGAGGALSRNLKDSPEWERYTDLY